MFKRLRLAAILLLAVTFLTTSAASGGKNEFHNEAIRAGWYGIFPQIPGYTHSFSKPVVKYMGYSQTARYVSKDDPDKVCDVTVGKDHVRFGQPALVRPLTWHRTDLLMANSRKVISFNGYGPDWKDQEQFVKHFDGERIAKAVAELPRQDFSIRKATFNAIPRKVDYEDLVDWVGTADEDIGSGIHIMSYPLLDGGRALVGTPDLKNVLYVRLQNPEETSKWRAQE